MENQSFVSDQKIWIDLAGTWSRRVNVCKFEEGVNAVNEVNQILSAAPGDVGGIIPFSHTIAEAEDVNRGFLIMQEFTNGIHYETTDLIDTPFTQRMGTVMEALYELSPENFRTKKDFLFFKCGSSLQNLLLEMVDSEVLRQSYEAMITELDTDEPSENFIEEIETANYWSVQFEKAAKIRDIANEFLAQHENEWENYSADEKITRLNEYAHQIGDVLDEKRWYDFFGNTNTIVAVRWDVNDPNYRPRTTYGYTYSQSRDGYVYINFEAATDTAKYTLPFVLDTVTHETRHQYQGQAHHSPERFNLPEDCQTKWFDRNKYEDYWRRPWEIDARAFAATTQLREE